MTREEAIRLIGWLKCTTNREDDLEAIDMAIEALKILGDDGIVNCCGCIHWKTDGGAMMMCELWDTPMGDFDYCSYGKREGGDDELIVVCHEDDYFERTPIEKQRVCCNCRNRKASEIVSKCMIDGHYIGYVQCFTNWCRHWATDELQWKDGDSE